MLKTKFDRAYCNVEVTVFLNFGNTQFRCDRARIYERGWKELRQGLVSSFLDYFKICYLHERHEQTIAYGKLKIGFDSHLMLSQNRRTSDIYSLPRVVKRMARLLRSS